MFAHSMGDRILSMAAEVGAITLTLAIMKAGQYPYKVFVFKSFSHEIWSITPEESSAENPLSVNLF
jgi:hypothetical protein